MGILQVLQRSRNIWLLVVFALYLTAIPVFAGVYFLLYRTHRGNFAFNSDIVRSQKTIVAASTRRLIDENNIDTADLLDLREQLNTSEIETSLQELKGRKVRAVLVESPQSRYTFFESETVLSFTGSEAIDSKLRVERRNGSVNEITNGPVVQLPKNAKAYQELCGRWLTLLMERKVELNRIEASLDTDAPDVWTFPDFVYFSAITQATVGYGDIVPNTTPVRLLVTVQTILSAAIVVVVINMAFQERANPKK